MSLSEPGLRTSQGALSYCVFWIGCYGTALVRKGAGRGHRRKQF